MISPCTSSYWGRIFEQTQKLRQAVSLQRKSNDSSTFESDVVKSQPMPWSKIRHQLLLNDNFKIFQIFFLSFYEKQTLEEVWMASQRSTLRQIMDTDQPPPFKLTIFL